MELRTTSAGYRLPQQKNVLNPKPINKSIPQNSGTKTVFNDNVDAVKVNKVLTNQILKEWKAVRAWHEKWSFLTEYDYNGNQKPPKELPTDEPYYNSGKVPITQSATYGNRQNSENSKM